MRDFLKKVALSMGALGALVLLIATLLQRPTTTKNKAQKASKHPDIILKQTDLSLFGNKNIKNCQIQAKESKMFTHEQKTECTDITCQFTTKHNVIATLKAPKAYIDHEKKQLYLPGSVTGTFNNSSHAQDWHLEKEDVFYNSTQNTIDAKHTKLTSCAGISIEAPKSTIDLKTEVISLEGGVVSNFEKIQKK